MPAHLLAQCAALSARARQYLRMKRQRAHIAVRGALICAVVVCDAFLRVFGDGRVASIWRVSLDLRLLLRAGRVAVKSASMDNDAR